MTKDAIFVLCFYYIKDLKGMKYPT